MYGAVEMETVEVCVLVRNGVPENDLSVPITVLPTSTAVGMIYLHTYIIYIDACLLYLTIVFMAIILQT